MDTDKLEKLIEESRNDLKETLDNVKKSDSAWGAILGLVICNNILDNVLYETKKELEKSGISVNNIGEKEEHSKMTITKDMLKKLMKLELGSSLEPWQEKVLDEIDDFEIDVEMPIMSELEWLIEFKSKSSSEKE